MADELLRSYRKGAFASALKESEHYDELKQILGRSFIVKLQSAVAEFRWIDAKATLDEWRMELWLWESSNDDLRQTANVCERMACMAEFWTNFERLEFARSKVKLDELRVICGRPGEADDEIEGRGLEHRLLENGEAIIMRTVSLMFQGGRVAAKREVDKYVSVIRKQGLVFPK